MHNTGWHQEDINSTTTTRWSEDW